jgi:replication factor C large subunit
MGFVGLLLKDKRIAAPLAAELELEAEEIALLMGSTLTTKKVQMIFEEAQKIRADLAIEEIELAWHGTAQRSLARAPEEAKTQARAGAGLAGPPEEGPSQLSASPGQEEPVAAKSEAPKRGRPRKAESEPRVEKKAEAAQEAGKRQKSLFDF